MIKTEYKNEEKNKLKFLFIPILSNKMIANEIIITEREKIKKFLMIFISFPQFNFIREYPPLRASSQRWVLGLTPLLKVSLYIIL
ncbi:MAG: hypothetical protein BGN93_08185 [Acinetobacter sp. 39-4]|nr:MAG: hypothetical protein BGN93_08185 [Acinetobacter sp. 39-4]